MTEIVDLADIEKRLESLRDRFQVLYGAEDVPHNLDAVETETKGIRELASDVFLYAGNDSRKYVIGAMSFVEPDGIKIGTIFFDPTERKIAGVVFLPPPAPPPDTEGNELIDLDFGGILRIGVPARDLVDFLYKLCKAKIESIREEMKTPNTELLS